MTTVVFLGPTMPRAEALAILPDAIYLPPAQQGDVISAILRYEPTVVALIDGAFLHSLAVWHKEILWAIDQGITVLGSSSMGALRAAECKAFGMVGVGRIYADYADGTLTADDEVAIVHADAAHGWLPMSEALVNVRATLAAATVADVLRTESALAVLAAGQQLYFPDRTWDAILAAASAAPDGPTSGELSGLRAFVRTDAVDQKRLDAAELLELIAAADGVVSSADSVTDDIESAWSFNNSRPFRGLLARDRKVYRDGGAVSVEQIFRHLMLHRPHSSDLLQQASMQELGIVFAEVLGLEATAEQTADETARFRRRLNLTEDDALSAYLQRNDLRPVDLADLMTRQATLRALVAWLRLRRYRIGLADPVLTEMRLRDEYAPWADRAARVESVLGDGAEPDELRPLVELAHDHIAHTSWRPEIELTHWATESDFGDQYQLHAALNRSAAARRELLARAGDLSMLDGLTEPE